MITKKISKEQEEKLLRLIYEKYVGRFGHVVSRVGEFPVLINSVEIYHREMPELIVKFGSVKRSRFQELLKELEASGDMRSEGSVAYYLTEAGYARAAMSPVDKLLDFCNRNQGLAIPISVVSLAISIIALFVSK
ncbi:hypothetical protein [Pseudomonas xanthosomatis]|uniref:hypothetical protein n=1 Tax=Pseudomonas xanthosomatis TaxID=2842356 RepID=UPI003518185B